MSPTCPLTCPPTPDIKESENIAALHNQITACDAILEVGGGQEGWHLSLRCPCDVPVVPRVSPMFSQCPHGVP